MFTEVYSAYMQIYGQNNNSTINVLINLASTMKDLEEYDEAIKHYEVAMEARRETSGEESVEYAMALTMTSVCYRELGKYDVADKMLKEAYMIAVGDSAEENTIPASNVLNSMGLLYKKQGKLERSKDAYQRALTVREAMLGVGHPETIATRHNLANLLLEMNLPGKSKEMFEENLRIMKDNMKDE